MINSVKGLRLTDFRPQRSCHQERLRLKDLYFSFKMPTVAEESIDAFQNYYARPPERPKKKSLKQMIYDEETSEYCGRTIESWGEWFNLKYRVSHFFPFNFNRNNRALAFANPKNCYFPLILLLRRNLIFSM